MQELGVFAGTIKKLPTIRAIMTPQAHRCSSRLPTQSAAGCPLSEKRDAHHSFLTTTTQ
jgi:hypothetical protein